MSERAAAAVGGKAVEEGIAVGSGEVAGDVGVVEMSLEVLDDKGDAEVGVGRLGGEAVDLVRRERMGWRPQEQLRRLQKQLRRL